MLYIRLLLINIKMQVPIRNYQHNFISGRHIQLLSKTQSSIPDKTKSTDLYFSLYVIDSFSDPVVIAIGLWSSDHETRRCARNLDWDLVNESRLYILPKLWKKERSQIDHLDNSEAQIHLNINLILPLFLVDIGVLGRSIENYVYYLPSV